MNSALWHINYVLHSGFGAFDAPLELRVFVDIVDVVLAGLVRADQDRWQWGVWAAATGVSLDAVVGIVVIVIFLGGRTTTTIPTTRYWQYCWIFVLRDHWRAHLKKQ